MGAPYSNQIVCPFGAGQRQVEPDFRLRLLAQMLRHRPEFVSVDGHRKVAVAETCDHFPFVLEALLCGCPVPGQALDHSQLMKSDVFERRVSSGGGPLAEAGEYFPGLGKLLSTGQNGAETIPSLSGLVLNQGGSAENFAEYFFCRRPVFALEGRPRLGRQFCHRYSPATHRSASPGVLNCTTCKCG